MALKYIDSPCHPVECISVVAGEDIACGLLIKLVLDADGNQVAMLAQDGERAIGISRGRDVLAGECVLFGLVNSRLPVLAAEPIPADSAVTTAAGGQARVALAGDPIHGFAWCDSAAAAGHFVSVLYQPHGRL